jgi:hypothetical protein
MNATLFATLAAGFLAAAGAATILTVDNHLGNHAGAAAGADTGSMHGGMAGDAMDAQLGMERLAFPQKTGSVPTADDAKKMPQLSWVYITNDTEFNPSNGVRGGSGTLDDPYVISGYYVTGDLYIADTDACVEITDNYLDGQLHLNWNGNCVFVHHNFIRDLRVNENNPRTGLDTGGLIELNQINYVGQIRHYDGEFRNNVVGPRDDANLPNGVFRDPENLLPFFKDTRVLNVDGFNEGLFDHNTIYGSVDLKLHGHHHSTGFLATHSHYHGDSQKLMAAMQHDHTNRWESVKFDDNHVVDTAGYGVRYTDEAHDGDDQTAASETTKQLEEPHQHHTMVEIASNQVEGAGIWVDILNADASTHKMWNPAWMTISDNQITMKQRDSNGLLGTQFFGTRFEANTGINVWAAKEAWITIQANKLTFTASGTNDALKPVKDLTPWFFTDDTPVAISLQAIHDANVTVQGNQATGFQFGLKASNLMAMDWFVAANDFASLPQQVYWDDTVTVKPVTQGPAPAYPDPLMDDGTQPYDLLPTTQADQHNHP